MQDGWTCTTDEYVTEMTHEPFFSNSASVHDKMCNCMSPMSMHKKKQAHESHEHAWRPNKLLLVNNRKHTHNKKNYIQKTILTKFWQDYPTCQDSGCDTPTNVGPPSPNFYMSLLVLQDEVPLAKTKSHLCQKLRNRFD